MSWRRITDWAKQSDATLRAADWLGRGRGRLRFLDQLGDVRKPRKPELSNWEKHELAAAWLGHATVLLRIGGMTILTDPVFSNRVGVGLGLITGGPRRLLAPALSIDELPPIDLALVSHAHFDHLDRPTLNRLDKKTDVVCAAATGDLIRDLGFARVTELRWGERFSLGPLEITARKVRHWGARSIFDSHRGYNAYLLESSSSRVLFGGDTAMSDCFDDIDGVDLAMLGIGGYDPYVAAHANPEQALEMAGRMKSDLLLPMHHSTFRLSHEPAGEPMERLLESAGRWRDRIVVTDVGGQWSN